MKDLDLFQRNFGDTNMGRTVMSTLPRISILLPLFATGCANTAFAQCSAEGRGGGGAMTGGGIALAVPSPPLTNPMFSPQSLATQQAMNAMRRQQASAQQLLAMQQQMRRQQQQWFYQRQQERLAQRQSRAQRVRAEREARLATRVAERKEELFVRRNREVLGDYAGQLISTSRAATTSEGGIGN